MATNARIVGRAGSPKLLIKYQLCRHELYASLSGSVRQHIFPYCHYNVIKHFRKPFIINYPNVELGRIFSSKHKISLMF
jgi:hypothetical protein